MPEGPEVKIITEWLKSICVGKYYMSLFIDISSKYYKYELTGMKHIKNIQTLRIDDIICKGKQIFFVLINDQILYDDYNNIYENYNKYYINSTLALEGYWSLQKQWVKSTGNSHSNLWITLGDKQNNKYENIFNLYFDDSRHHGNIRILNEQEYTNKINKDIGPDLLNEEVEWDLYYTKVKNIMDRTRTLTLEDFLLKQNYFSGIGNYLKSDILYLSRLNPYRNIKSLKDMEKYELYTKSILIIHEAYNLGGMTIKSFKNPFNKDNNYKGGYIPYVYGKIYDTNGYKILKTNGQNDTKRTTYWVQQLQL